MNSKKYWEKRTAREAYEMYEDAEKVAEELKKAYSGASAYLQRQAEGLFEKFRQKYGLSDAEARRLLNSLHDSTSINELIQKLRTCEQTDDIKELRKHIEAAAYGARLRRMAGIQDSIDRLMKRLFGKTVKLASDWLQRLAGESYYKHMFELCKRTGFLLKFNGLSERAIMKLLKTKWLGGDFSSRLWENTKRLAEKLKEELLVSMLTGRTDRETANVINDEFRKGASAARRLVRTESNHVYTEARFIGTEECGIEEYIFLATLDRRTSKICRSLDGKRFKVKDRKVGTNCPPMHPWCRSTTLDYFGEEWLKTGTRSALDPVTGKRIKVPLSMTYKEWYEKYVKGHEKEILQREKEQNNNRRLSSDKDQYERYKKVLGDEAPETLEDFLEIKYNNKEKYGTLKHLYRVANQYESNSGEMSAGKITELHDAATKAKALFNSKGRNGANMGVMEIDGELVFANSRANRETDPCTVSYKGDKEKLILQPKEQRFQTKYIGTHDRNVDSEAKLLEYAATIAEDGKEHTINLLSERCMCESCQGVLQQFKERYPNVKINVVSHRSDRAEENKNRNRTFEVDTARKHDEIKE